MRGAGGRHGRGTGAALARRAAVLASRGARRLQKGCPQNPLQALPGNRRHSRLFGVADGVHETNSRFMDTTLKCSQAAISPALT
jgi:hypothetical protein